MSLRQKLLLLFSLTVAAAVAAVAYTVLLRIRDVFEEHDRQETALFVSQFQRAFQHRSADVEAAVQHLAAEERVRSMAAELAQTGDGSPYVTAAGTLAQDAQLDFLEIIGADGKIVSSAQWPARFGYPEPAVLQPAQHAFLKQEEMPDGSTQLGLFAIRGVHGPEPAVHLIGGIHLNRDFLADLPVAEGMQIALYTPSVANDDAGTVASSTAFDAANLVTLAGPLPYGTRYHSIVLSALTTGQQTGSVLYLTSRREDSVNATAIPLRNESGKALAVLVVAVSRAGMVQAQLHIRAIAYGIAAAGILLAIVFSLWIAARVSRPIEQLASAAEEVAAGRWDVRVPERGRDEVSVLARSFNHMTEELMSQRERLVQSERVAAWRELARRLAHELKNPLFPLQLTVENMVRARRLPEAEFDEVFRESATTLSMEIANLKAIIGRFSDFSKMPQPELCRIDVSDCIWRVALLHFPGLVRSDSRAMIESTSGSNIKCTVQVDTQPLPIDADPELLHRALSNLVLNAIDAMPEGGSLELSVQRREGQVEIRVSDSGEGLTPEECERLFTPYYTTKEHGTGLGLAIVQSVVADHKGTISVESSNGDQKTGATFIIKLPLAEGEGA
ncbi:ATP-binding protein [Acidicapsa dinghuensis]|uniref:Signal transduction histidine-protein kinase/phosphatase MprB n=1 Tax=Acidicapsa dinghuensis TaxID=2218256 RepID=A0ABW1EM67_9BACT|nr:ATP-binding protein [Acidicapsa dinghuensis]